MKKTLIICSHYPLPEHVGTNIRTMNFVRFFKQYGTVDIAYSHTLPGGKTGNSVFSNEYYLARESVKSFWERLMRWININRRPLQIPKYTDVDEKKLLSLIISNNYDYIFVRYVLNTWGLFKIPSKYKMRVIVDFDDILSGPLYEETVNAANGYFRRLRLRLNRRYLIDYEKKCLNFGSSLFCSEKDRLRMIERHNQDSAFVVPNVYHNKSFEDCDFGDGFLNENILLFVGGLMYKPNIDGLRWFIKSVFLNFKKKYPDAKLLLVGHSPVQEIVRLCKENVDIKLYANMPDIREYYKQCKAVIVPLLTGGGTRIKILEASLANRPVLSTSVGAEGLDLADGDDLLLFEDAQDFSNQYEKLLDRRKYDSLIQNSKKIVANKYSTKSFNSVMEKVLSKIHQ
jgi:glycosyltransferase involved in cell wall biosynthesis